MVDLDLVLLSLAGSPPCQARTPTPKILHRCTAPSLQGPTPTERVSTGVHILMVVLVVVLRTHPHLQDLTYVHVLMVVQY